MKRLSEKRNNGKTYQQQPAANSGNQRSLANADRKAKRSAAAWRFAGDYINSQSGGSSGIAGENRQRMPISKKKKAWRNGHRENQ